MTGLLLLLLSCFSHVRLCVTPEVEAHQIPRPWDSPGKNTGVGCHFLLQCMKVKSEREVTQSCLTLHDHEFLQLLFIWKCLDSSSLLKNSFARFRIFGWQFFSFFFFLWAFWIYLSTFLWPPKFLIRKSTDNLIKDPWYVMICFSVAAFKILLFVFWKFDYNQSHCGSLWILLMDSVELGCLHFCLHQIWGVFNHYLFQMFFLPFFHSLLLLLGLPQYIGPSDGVPWTS